MGEKYRQKEFFKKMNQLVGGEICEADWENYTAFSSHTLVLLEICAGLCEEVAELKQRVINLEGKVF